MLNLINWEEKGSETKAKVDGVGSERAAAKNLLAQVHSSLSIRLGVSQTNWVQQTKPTETPPLNIGVKWGKATNDASLKCQEPLYNQKYFFYEKL